MQIVLPGSESGLVRLARRGGEAAEELGIVVGGDRAGFCSSSVVAAQGVIQWCQRRRGSTGSEPYARTDSWQQ